MRRRGQRDAAHLSRVALVPIALVDLADARAKLSAGRCDRRRTSQWAAHFLTTPATGRHPREGTIMHVEHHELHREFPEFLDAMRLLRSSDDSFSRMFDEYHSLTSEVERLEEEDVPVDDFTIEEMKKVRARLKDKMYRMLVASRNGKATS